MAASALNIVNAALVELGAQGGLNSLDDPDPRAAQARRIYPIVRDAMLSSHPWGFALHRVSIAKDAARPAFGWSYAYSLPSDYLQAYRLNGELMARLRWAAEGDKLLTDEDSPIALHYIRRVEDTTQWRAWFDDAMVAAVAARLALPVTATSTVVAAARQEAQRRLAEARWMDAKEHGRHGEAYGPLESARWLVD